MSKESPAAGIPASPLAPHLVHLLYDSPPQVDWGQLTERVQALCGPVSDHNLPGPGSKLAQYFMLEAQVTFKEGTMPSQLCLAAGSLPQELIAASLGQTWDWPQAAETVAACPHVLIANDFMAAGLEPEVRNRQFRNFVRAVHELHPCRAIHWMHTGVVTDPARFLYLQDEDAPGAPLYGSINVRMFNIQGTDGDMVMDSMGLACLGLPDVQCHFRGLDPGAIAALLYNVSLHLFTHGDIIEDGHTVPGIDPGDRWVCRHEMALAAPERVVLDINPGEPWSAGGR